MPTIISPAIFKAEISIAQTENPYQNSSVQEFIDKYEPYFLALLLGKGLAKEFADGLLEDPIDQKWIELRDETDLKQMIANFVYYWFKRYETTKSMGISEVKPKAENAYPTNSVDKQVSAWNDMARMARFFDLDVSIYPLWVRPNFRNYRFWYSGCGVSEIYFNINGGNI